MDSCEDFNDLRNSRLHIQCGKNPVENKMPEAHFFIEAMERGARIVTITPEYSPPATRSDYWIPIQTATDTWMPTLPTVLTWAGSRTIRFTNSPG